MKNQEEYIIRKLEKEDFFRGHLQLLKQLTSIDPDQININNYINFISNLDDRHQIFVICENNKIVATGTLLIEDKLIRNISKMAHIEDIVVDNNYRGKGLGKKIINFLVGCAETHGCYKVNLNCNDKNIKFYENCNFNRNGSQMSIYIQSKL